jgi:hypothetical protein
MIVAHRREHHFGPEQRAVLAHAPSFLAEASALARFAQLLVRAALGDGLGRKEAGIVTADDLRSLVTLVAFGAAVPGHDIAVQVQHVDGVVLDRVHHVTQHVDAPDILGGRRQAQFLRTSHGTWHSADRARLGMLREKSLKV